MRLWGIAVYYYLPAAVLVVNLNFPAADVEGPGVSIFNRRDRHN